MATSSSIDLHEMADDCVDNMGDIFWDYDARRDTLGDYRDPREVAVGTVERTLRRMVANLSSSEPNLSRLHAEYTAIIADLPTPLDRARLLRELVKQADWTEHSAREVLTLAQQYGTSALRKALALALVMGIEDGNVGP